MDNYFKDYENLEIHELMLKDRPRQEAYYKAIMNNKDLFNNKVVLDVGAGTGILSVFCVKAGARLVYAVEASGLAKIALNVVEENGLTDKIKVIHSRVEDFILPSGSAKVDIIVSEWMGFYLLHEGMLDSVLFARDTFLKADGTMFPSECTLFVAPCSVPSLFEYWDNIDGVQMARFATQLRQQKATKPEIMNLDSSNLRHEGVVVHWMSLLDVTVAELNEIQFKDVITTQNPGKHQGFCIWFEVRFPGMNAENEVVLSTSPHAPETHWKQCVVVLPDNACETLEEKAPVAFKILMSRNTNDSRKYNLEVTILDPNVEEHPMPCSCYMTKCILVDAHLKTLDTS